MRKTLKPSRQPRTRGLPLALMLSLLCALTPVAHASVNCDGTDDGLTLSGVTPGAAMTVAAWVFPIPSSSSYGTWLASSSGGSGWWYRGGSFLQHWEIGGVGNAESTTALTENAWNHVALTLSSGTITFYLNGVADGTGTLGSSTYVSVCTDALGDTFKGILGDLRIYDVVLGVGEIQALAGMRQHFTALSRQPLAYWVLDQCADGTNGNGTVFVDRSDHGNTLTADDGANNTGMTCGGQFSYPWGAN